MTQSPISQLAERVKELEFSFRNEEWRASYSPSGSRGSIVAKDCTQDFIVAEFDPSSYSGHKGTAKSRFQFIVQTRTSAPALARMVEGMCHTLRTICMTSKSRPGEFISPESALAQGCLDFCEAIAREALN